MFDQLLRKNKEKHSMIPAFKMWVLLLDILLKNEMKMTGHFSLSSDSLYTQYMIYWLKD